MKRITVDNFRNDRLYPAIRRATRGILMSCEEVSPVDLFIRLGMLSKHDLRLWREGRIPYLERAIRVNLIKCGRVLRILGMHAHDLRLDRREVVYRPTPPRKGRTLQFSKTAIPRIERAYSTHFVIVGRVEKFRAKLRDGAEFDAARLAHRDQLHEPQRSRGLPVDDSSTKQSPR